MIYQYLVGLGCGKSRFKPVGPVECIEIKAEYQIGVSDDGRGFIRPVLADDQITFSYAFCDEIKVCRTSVVEDNLDVRLTQHEQVMIQCRAASDGISVRLHM